MSMDKRTLISRLAVEEEDSVALAQFLDKSAQADKSSAPASTAFLNPRQQTLCTLLAKQTAVLPHAFCGGFPDAERKVAVFLPDLKKRAQNVGSLDENSNNSVK